MPFPVTKVDVSAFVMHVPLAPRKQPADSWMPLANVEDALLDVTSRAVVCSPAPKVDVAEPKIVVVAVPPIYARSKMERSVVEAPPVKSIVDVVALCPAAGWVKASYAVMPLVAHALAFADTVPSAPTCKQRVPAPPAEDTMRFVELAVVALTMVVLANGMERPVPAGAAKLMVSAEPTSAPVPESEIAVPATGEDVATD